MGARIALALERNATSWVLLNLAAIHWRIVGEPVHVRCPWPPWRSMRIYIYIYIVRRVMLFLSRALALVVSRLLFLAGCPRIRGSVEF